MGRRRRSSWRTMTVGSIASGTVGCDRLARLMRTVGSVEMTSEPAAPALKGLAAARAASSRPEEGAGAGVLSIVRQRFQDPPAGDLEPLLLERRQRSFVSRVRAGIRRIIHGAPGALS